jgi:uncharacterized protein
MRSSRFIIVSLLLLILFCTTVPRAAAQAKGRPEAGKYDTGYALKKPVFGGAGPINGWGAIGTIVKDVMKPYGWDIQICSSCAGAARAARLVAAAAVPPKPAPNSPEAPPPNGPVDFGATGANYLWWAFQGSHDFASDPEGARKQLRLIANIQSPSYILAAVKSDSGITDLRQIKDKRMPVRILTTQQTQYIVPAILEYYGLSKEIIESFGGSLAPGNNAADRKAFDVIIASGLNDYMPEYEIWVDLSQRFDLKFLELPADLRTNLAKDFDLEERNTPLNLIRGIDRPIPSLVRTGTVIYGRDDMPEDFAYTLAKALDEHQDLLQWSNVTYSYNPYTVWKAYGSPVHPGAARYYRERGYMK